MRAKAVFRTANGRTLVLLALICFLTIGVVKAFDFEDPFDPPDPVSLDPTAIAEITIQPDDIWANPADIRQVVEPDATISFIEDEMPKIDQPVQIGMYPTFEIGMPDVSQSQ